MAQCVSATVAAENLSSARCQKCTEFSAARMDIASRRQSAARPGMPVQRVGPGRLAGQHVLLEHGVHVLDDDIEDVLFQADVRVQTALEDAGCLGDVLGESLGVTLLVEDIRRLADDLPAPEAAVHRWPTIARARSA
jgi:hypothetical protein